jgi:hypothetical protein
MGKGDRGIELEIVALDIDEYVVVERPVASGELPQALGNRPATKNCATVRDA